MGVDKVSKLERGVEGNEKKEKSILIVPTEIVKMKRLTTGKHLLINNYKKQNTYIFPFSFW